MKNYQRQILLPYALATGGIMAGLGIVLSQLFPLFFFETAISLFVTFLVLILVSYLFVKKWTKPIDDVAEVAIELAKGNYHARVYETNSEYSSSLHTSMNILARNLQEMTKVREIEQERLNTLIENMGNSLLMIGRGGHIILANNSFLHEFSLMKQPIFREPFKSIGIPDDLEEFIEHVFLTETPERKQITITTKNSEKVFEVYGAPVIGDFGRWLGIVVVLHDITELIRLENVRKDFVANVSHELRTPVTSIKGFAETLLDGAMEDPNARHQFLQIILTESERLQILIQDLLELSKMERLGFHLDLQQVNLLDILHRGEESVRKRLSEKHMDVKFEGEANVCVMADPNRLMQIIVNLLTNAIAYSPEFTTVTITVNQTENEGIFQIADQGIGMEEEEIPRVFERFYRVDKARSKNSGGTGLGLAIVKHLVEAHHGRISITSARHVGTTFEIALPTHKQN